MICPVCRSSKHLLFDQDKFRTYYRCGDCTLVYVPQEFFLSAQDERARYSAHQNFDEEYEKYLSQIASAIFPIITKDHLGLDFGCGASKLMQKVFEKEQVRMDSYDLYFFPKEEIWSERYDFIVLSEVIEHLRDPLETMEKLAGLIRPRGQIFIKTKFYSDDPAIFKNWFYKRDLTHIKFYNTQSMEALARALKMKGPQALSLPDLYQLSF